MNYSFDFNDDQDERLTGMLHELGSTWFFGWGQGMVQDLSEGGLFEEFPRRWKSGIIHPVGADPRSKVQDYKAMYEALYQLQKLQDAVKEREIVYSKYLLGFCILSRSRLSPSRSFHSSGQSAKFELAPALTLSKANHVKTIFRSLIFLSLFLFLLTLEFAKIG